MRACAYTRCSLARRRRAHQIRVSLQRQNCNFINNQKIIIIIIIMNKVEEEEEEEDGTGSMIRPK